MYRIRICTVQSNITNLKIKSQNYLTVKYTKSMNMKFIIGNIT